MSTIIEAPSFSALEAALSRENERNSRRRQELANARATALANGTAMDAEPVAMPAAPTVPLYGWRLRVDRFWRTLDRFMATRIR